MKSVADNDTIQIEITNVCPNRCSNCTRYVGLAKPYCMDFEYFKKAVDSLERFHNMVGVMGGEPLLHPQFDQICEYAFSKFPREQLGLWTCFPKGSEKYRELIVRTFGNVFLNDHSRADIWHHPFLVAAADLVPSRDMIFYVADKCYFQRAWSASINPRGAYFCEMAASYAMLFPQTTMDGWELTKGWWRKTTKDYRKQIEAFCEYCGGALFLKRRKSVNGSLYDITETNLDRMLHEHPKVDLKRFVLYDEKDLLEAAECQETLAAYKDPCYRNDIAARYGIGLTVNRKGFNEPYLLKKVYAKGSILDSLKKKYAFTYENKGDTQHG